MSRTLIALVLGLAALLIPASASGVWGGAPDTAHPQVGALYYDFGGDGLQIGDLVCSGSYAGASVDDDHDVFLLAGHCLPPAEAGIPAGDLYVSFSSNIGLNPSSPVSNPIQVEEYHQMPGFGRNLGDLRDLGVLLLGEGSVSGITPVQLAPAGYLDALKKAGTLKFREMTVVGYGVTPVWDPAGPTFFTFDGVRKSGSSTVIGLGKAFVHFSQNNGVGTGSGVCFGDSGSPQIDENVRPAVVISVTSGGNGQCNANNYNYRVDTPQAREFLGQYIDLS